jgi:3,4-dihydroxy 2-butanone 4-phosphate synthase/GTP cyclohydrolase II
VGLEGYGLTIVDRVQLHLPITPQNARYMETKREKMGHLIGAVS